MKTRKIVQALTALALAATMTAPVTANADWTEKTDTYEGSFSGTDVSEKQEQNIHVKLDAEPSYLVTIPAIIALTDEDNDGIYDGSGEIKAEKIHLEDGTHLEVTIKSFFELNHFDSTLSYQASKSDSFDSILNSGDVIGTFESNVGDTADTPLTVYFRTTEELKFAGDYYDTVTFAFATTAPEE